VLRFEQCNALESPSEGKSCVIIGLHVILTSSKFSWDGIVSKPKIVVGPKWIVDSVKQFQGNMCFFIANVLDISIRLLVPSGRRPRPFPSAQVAPNYAVNYNRHQNRRKTRCIIGQESWQLWTSCFTSGVNLVGKLEGREHGRREPRWTPGQKILPKSSLSSYPEKCSNDLLEKCSFIH